MQYVKYLFSLHFEHFCNVMNGVPRTHSKYSFLLHMQISSFIIYFQAELRSSVYLALENTRKGDPTASLLRKARDGQVS